MQIDLEIFQKYISLTSPELFTEFLNKLENLFLNFMTPYKTEEEYIDSIVKSIQLWSYSLPKYSKISNKVYFGKGQYQPLNEDIIKFRETLKNPNLDSYKYLTTKLPEIFKTDDYTAMFNKIVETKNTLENILIKLYESLKLDIKSILAVDTKDIYETLQTWYKALPELNKHTLFENGEEEIFKTINLSLKENQIIDELSMTLLGILPREFEEDTPYTFTKNFIRTKETIEICKSNKLNFTNSYQLYHVSNGKKKIINTFSISSPNKYSNLLKREIKNIMDEYGHALSCNQKRQILINLLNEVQVNKTL